MCLVTLNKSPKELLAELKAQRLKEPALSLPKPDKQSALKAKKQIFKDKYRIKILKDKTVQFSLPPGTSRMDLINEAQAFVYENYNKLKAVARNRIKEWNETPSIFLNKVRDNFPTKSICGYVRGSEEFDSATQSENGWNNVSFRDLVTAHAAYLVITGKDLFDGHPVRTKEGAVLRFRPYGLVYSKNDKLYRKSKIAACKLAAA